MTLLPVRWRPAFLLALALVVFLPLLGKRDIVTSHEARVAQTARQMAAAGWPWEGRTVAVPVVSLQEKNGAKRLAPAPGGGTTAVNPWLVPVLNGQIRLQKPPLPYWCAAVLFKLTGAGDEIGEAAARRVPAVFGAVAVLLVFDLGRRLFGSVTGWLAGLVWVSSYFVFDEYRKAMADPYLAFFTLLCVWAWVRAGEGRWGGGEVGGGGWKKQQSKGAETSGGGAISLPTPHSPPPHPLLFLFYLSLALGVFAKGPLVFLHVALALAAYHVCFRRRPPVRGWHHLLGVALLLAVALPWPVYVFLRVPNALKIWRYESVGEFADNARNARQWWFYAPGVFQITLPWTPLWVLGVIRAARSKDRRVWFPVLWFAATVIVFSASNVKKNAYLLPVLPAAVLTAAHGLRWVVAGARVRAARGRAEGLLVAMVVAGGVFGLAVPILIGRATPAAGAAWQRAGLGLAAFVAALAAGVPPFLAWRRLGPRPWATAQAVVFAAAVAVFFDFYHAPAENRRSARAACRFVREMLDDPDTTLLTSAVVDEASVYLPLGVKFDPAGTRVLVLIDTRTQTAKPDRDWFQSRLPDARVAAVEPVWPKTPAADPRWKVYAVTVDHRWLAGAFWP